MVKFYDFHVNPEFSEGESSLEEMAKRAKLLDFSGICLVEEFKKKNQIESLKKQISEVSKKTKLEIFLGFEAKNSFELNKLAKTRKEYDVLLVEGGNLSLNRKAAETPEVDILTHPELGRRDSGLNHVMAKLATENHISIEINFREILLSSKNTRSHIVQKMAKNVELCQKYHTPIIICSGGFSHLQLKDPKILTSMGCLLGLEINEAKRALSEVPESIIKMIRERQSEKWVRPGVMVK